MARANREWKTFADRWDNTSRFGWFVALAVVVHLALVLVVAVPAQLGGATVEQMKEEAARREAEKQQERERAAEEATDEVKKILKDELANEQLKKLFDELTGDFLTPEMAEDYWQELLEELDAELEQLTALFNEPERFDPVEAERQAQAVREEMVRKLADLAEQRRTQPLREEIARRAAEAAKQLEEFYRRELAERVGKPAGEPLRQAVDKASAEAVAALQKADASLEAQARAVAETVKRLERAEANLTRLKERGERATKEQDGAAALQALKDVRAQKAEGDAAARELDRTRTELQRTGSQIAAHAPAVAEHLKKTDANRVTPAAETARTAAKAASEGKANDAAAATRQAKEHAQTAAVEIGRARAAVKLQLAAEEAAKLERLAATEARAAQQLERDKQEAEKSNDPARKTKNDQDVAAAERRANQAATAAREMPKQLAELREAVREVGSADPLAERNLQTAAERATQQLERARQELESQAPARAAENLKEAAKTLAEIQRELERTGERIGLRSEPVGTATLRGVEAERDNELARHAAERFAEEYRKRGLPALAQRLRDALEQRLKEEGGLSEAMRGELRKDLEKALERDLVRGVEADRRVAEGAAERLPDSTRGEGAVTGRAADAARQAGTTARSIVDRTLPSVIDAGVRGVSADVLAARPGQSDPNGELAKRLAIFRNQLNAGRKDFLDTESAASVAAARQRAQQRQQTISRLGGLRVDAEAYRKIVEQIKDRGQILGEDFALKRGEGDLLEVREEALLRPALVSAPDVQPEKTLDTPTERKVQTPAFRTNRFTGVPFLTADAIRIDGDLSDWKDLPRLEMDPVVKAAAPGKIVSKPAHQTAWFAYSPQGLLLAFDVEDTTAEIENQLPVGQFWLNDCVEIFIDTLNTKYAKRGEANTHQFFAFPLGHKNDDKTGGYESLMALEDGKLTWKHVPYPLDRMPRVGRKTEKGWTLEMLIPKELLRKGEVKPGRIVGFNLQLDTGSNLYYYWTAAAKIQSSEHPDTWGDVQFLGSDGKLELFDADGKETLKSLVPGRTVKVKVTDPDMNLDDGNKDRVSATLRSASGESLVVILEETDVRSGVFEGVAGTRLNIGSALPGVLPVFEGEVVTVEYVDQVRSFGERNVPVRARFAIGSVGTKLEPQ